ncbi:hypothetical protein ACROYT_G014799 [Oculina patagonica]
MSTAPGHKAIIGKEEVSQLFDQLLGASREKSKIDVERLIQLYDGSTWVYTSGTSKDARRVIDCPGASLSGYSQPNRFFPIYMKLKERRDGAVDRLLMYQPMPHRLTANQTREFITRLNASEVKDLSQWQRNLCNDDVSKDDRHVLRLTAVLHVFYDQLKKALRGEDLTPPPGVITITTLKQAIALCQYFTTQRRILDQGSSTVLLQTSTDGRNPFNKNKTSYSTWPIKLDILKIPIKSGTFLEGSY